ncbi:aldehyde dehydrogenase family protein [Marinobacterium jannaschii]|uniref:aldehyde dehydrogenase family protein n=1 Tax=Marinobacterium jannaschii TaxID=64970 RepID=UPI00068768DF|nr:aldehyde dehydrogenase family protein [Marinobacterium jannaschii]
MQTRFETLSPVDNSVFLCREYANDTEIEQALQRACDAQAEWQQLALPQRAAYCLKMLDSVSAASADIARELCWMMGRPISQGAGEVSGFIERARYMISIAEQALAPTELADSPQQRRYIRHRPLGNCLLIAPWNYPYLTTVNTLIPALMAGNTVLLKPSSQTPLCAERLAGAFRQAGLPDGVFQYLYLDHQQSLALAADSRIDHISFTGSNAGGDAIEHALAGQFKSLTLELGGKDPAYVRPDADLDLAVASVLEGAFYNSGQSCCAIERLYLHKDICQAFIDRAVAAAYHYQPGRPDHPDTVLGPMVNARAAQRVRAQAADALAKGGVALLDSARFSADQPGSAYLAPQLIAHADHSMTLMTEETFGPLLGIMQVADDDEAIRLMNDSDYGLTAALYSRDIDSAVNIGNRLHCGTLFLIRCDYLDPALAWSGTKGSGRGCSLSSLGYQQLTRPQSYNLNGPPRVTPENEP